MESKGQFDGEDVNQPRCVFNSFEEIAIRRH